MADSIGTVLGAAIGAIAGISGGMLALWHNSRLEREKWLRARQDSVDNELRSSVRQLTIELAAAAHAMSWLTWRAKEAPSRLTQKNIDEYETKIHKILPQIMGRQAEIAALDQGTFEALCPTVNAVLAMDALVGKATLVFDGQPASAGELAGLRDEVEMIERSLPNAIAKVVGRRIAPTDTQPVPTVAALR